MTYLELIIDLHKNAKRQGPGSKEDTLRALKLLNLPDNKEWLVADIGCGTGGQTLTLAQQLQGQITAIDLFPNFLSELAEKAEETTLKASIKTLEANMETLPFEPSSLDLIWSEGAIYNLGFERGIQEWYRYLKPKGYLCVSEITWISQGRPKEIRDFWNQEYPEIDIASKKISLLEENGYSLVGYFYLPPSSWLDGYYRPMEHRFDAFLERHRHSDLAKQVVQESKTEIELYQKYKEYYSYGFYVAQKV